MADRTDAFKAAALGLTLMSAGPVLAEEKSRAPVTEIRPTFEVESKKFCPEGMTCQGGSFVLQPADVPRNMVMGVGLFKGEKRTLGPNEGFRVNEPKGQKGVVGVGINVRF